VTTDSPTEPGSLADALTRLRDIRLAIEARNDDAFHARLAELRRWQSDKVARFHQQRAAQYNGADLLDFLTRRFYLNGNWSELTAQPHTIEATVGRIVKKDRPLVIAIELQAVADSLDRDMADALLVDPRLPSGRPLDAYSYIRAIRAVGRQDERQRQIAWLDALIGEVAGYANSKTAWWGFKVVSKPAHALGMGATYDLLADGFAAMRACHDMPVATRGVVDAQKTRLERLLGPCT